jgi:hypothetical protein
VDLTEAADLATAGGTLVLAIATFASIRSGQRAARIAEPSLLAGLRPLLFPTRLGDPSEKVGFSDRHYVVAEGGRATIEATDQAIYMAMTVRNVGSGLAVMDRWALEIGVDSGTADQPAAMSQFRRLTRDIYVPPNDYSFWQGAIRDTSDPLFAAVRDAVDQRTQIVIQLLYGDLEGGQRTVSRFAFNPAHDGSWLVALARHYYLDRDNPR